MVEIGEDIPQAERSQEFTMQPRKVLLLMDYQGGTNESKENNASYCQRL